MVKKKKAANIKDVAALAGVSIATVSRYLNGDLKRMSTQTADKVKDAIEKLNYVPNSIARQMITKSSRMIAVIVANVDDYFSTELFKGISSILESRGYIGVLFDADADIERERHLLATIGSQLFDGLIIQAMNSAQTIQQELHRQLPIVGVDRQIDASPWPQVLTDNYEIARSATKYFVDQGFTHVVILTSEISLARTREERYRGILSATDHVDVVEVSEITHNHQHIQNQLISAIRSTDEKTLIFSLKERWLLEFIPNLIFSGVLDNEKVTATGFADTEIARRLEPKIRLISQNPYLMGASAAEVLLRVVTGNRISDNQERIVLPAKFE